MEKVPTAKEFWDSKCKTDELKSPGDIMIEFAKLHVEEALKAAANEAITEFIPFTDDEDVDRDSILNSYPLTNIK